MRVDRDSARGDVTGPESASPCAIFTLARMQMQIEPEPAISDLLEERDAHAELLDRSVDDRRASRAKRPRFLYDTPMPRLSPTSCEMRNAFLGEQRRPGRIAELGDGETLRAERVGD